LVVTNTTQDSAISICSLQYSHCHFRRSNYEYKNISLSTIASCRCLLLIHSLISVRSPYSYHKRDMEHLLSLTDSFTWEELPTRDPDTGNLTKAGYIPIIQTIPAYIIVLSMVYHTVQSTVRIVLSHDMLMTTWYPFDASVSPMYEIANLTQVIFVTQTVKF
jgi:hypothetical protein